MKASRRSFLQAAAAMLATRTPLRASGGAHDSEFDPWIEIDRAALRHNVLQVSRRVAGRPILAVIKNNGYGLGLVEVARLLDPMAEIGGLAVVKVQEAHALVDAGIRKPVLFMGPFGENDLVDAAARGIRPMIYTAVGPELDRISARLQRSVPIHLCIDTGIGRVGVPYPDAAPLVRDLARRRSVRVEGTMMTFTEDAEYDKVQLRRFTDLCGALAAEGIQLGLRHAASSFALFQHPEAFLDMVRPGMALFGIYPEKGFRAAGILDLRPAIALKAKVVYVKRLRPGESAGYNRAYTARKDVWVATLPVGHADGYPRAAAGKAQVRIGGTLYPVIASVSASHTIVEIGEEPRVRIGDTAVLFDGADGSRPEDVSAATGVSVYDLTMHLGALLPRKVL